MTLKNKTVTIFGATGAQGSPVVAEALAKGYNVRAVARDVQKIKTMHPEASAVQADLGDEEALIRALEGVDAAFLHFPTPQGPDDHQNWVNAFFSAAHKVELPLLIYVTGGPSGQRFPSSVIVDATNQGIESILNSGIPSIVLQSAIYLENLLPDLFLPRLRSEGVLDYPPVSKSLKFQWTSHYDQARIAVAAFSRLDLAGKAFEIGSPDALTGQELALLMGNWVDREVDFQPVSPQEFGQRIGDAFNSEGTTFALSDLYGAIAQLDHDSMKVDTDLIESTFGVTLTTVAEHIESWPKSSTTEAV